MTWDGQRKSFGILVEARGEGTLRLKVAEGREKSVVSLRGCTSETYANLGWPGMNREGEGDRRNRASSPKSREIGEPKPTMEAP